MRLDEITPDIRNKKKLIDLLYTKYTISRDSEVRQELISQIDKLYPSGYNGMDESIAEYRKILQDELIEAIQKLPRLS